MGDAYDLRDFGNVVRLFPLPGVVHFPHSVLPLHIFEPRYRQMTADALAGDMLVTMAKLREPVDWSAGEPALEDVACLGRILNHERLPDGRYNFLLLGLKRVRLVRELGSDKLYRRAEVQLLDDIEPEVPAVTTRMELAESFRQLAAIQGALDPDLERLLRSDVRLSVLSDVIAHAVALPPDFKQELLAEPRVGLRAERLRDALRELVGQVGPGARHRYPPPINLN